MPGWAETSVQLPIYAPTAPILATFSQQLRYRSQLPITLSGAPPWEKWCLSQSIQLRRTGRGADLVKVRSTAADTWRSAYVMIQRGPNLLLVIPEGMIHPDGTRHTRLSLIAEKKPGVYRGSLDGSAYEVTPTP
jgi:hypothetical protein